MEISDRREVRVSVGEKEFAFVADPGADRVTIREELPGEPGSRKTGTTMVLTGEELQAFMQGLTRVMANETAPPPPSANPQAAPSAAPSPALSDPETIERARSRNPNAFKPWTRDEERRLQEGVRAGNSVEELAAELERSPRAVAIRLQRLGARAR